MSWSLERILSQVPALLEASALGQSIPDVVLEMQAKSELRTLRTGRDYRASPKYQQGFLGADIALRLGTALTAWPASSAATRGGNRRASPLAAPGLRRARGRTFFCILAVNGRAVGRDVTPQMLLVNQAGTEVSVLVRPPVT